VEDGRGAVANVINFWDWEENGKPLLDGLRWYVFYGIHLNNFWLETFLCCVVTPWPSLLHILLLYCGGAAFFCLYGVGSA